MVQREGTQAKGLARRVASRSRAHAACQARSALRPAAERQRTAGRETVIDEPPRSDRPGCALRGRASRVVAGGARHPSARRAAIAALPAGRLEAACISWILGERSAAAGTGDATARPMQRSGRMGRDVRRRSAPAASGAGMCGACSCRWSRAAHWRRGAWGARPPEVGERDIGARGRSGANGGGAPECEERPPARGWHAGGTSTPGRPAGAFPARYPRACSRPAAGGRWCKAADTCGGTDERRRDFAGRPTEPSPPATCGRAKCPTMATNAGASPRAIRARAPSGM
jgi:hypothetical protein